MTNREPPADHELLEVERARFDALLILITNESQLIWSRYNCLLTANTIIASIVGVLFTKIDSKVMESGVLVVVSAFGFMLSWQWRRLTYRGWELAHAWVETAKRIRCWHNKPGPFEAYSDWTKDHKMGEGNRDWIAYYAQGVIKLFLAAYALGTIAGAALVIMGLNEQSTP